MIGLAVVLATLVVLAYAALIIIFSLGFKRFTIEPDHWPPLAILLAVRNEEAYLPACLDHLLAMDYPEDQLQLWIGNDASEDNTLAIAERYARRDARIRIVNITGHWGEARAKANVLAQLVAASSQADRVAEVMLITDADVRVNPNWAKRMIGCQRANPPHRSVGIVTGTTVVAGTRAWAIWQRIDWLFAIGMVKVASDVGVPVATLGNNMLLSRTAYQATGGYESMPFSITEDFQILHALVKQDYGFRNVLDKETRVMTQPMGSLWALLRQRKRWTRGAMQLPLYLISILLLQALFYPLLVYMATQDVRLATGLWLSKVALQYAFIWLVIRKVGLSSALKRQTLRQLLPFELYNALLSLVSLLYYLVPDKIVWKGRKFN